MVSEPPQTKTQGARPSSSLFREDAIQNKQTRRLGTVMLAPALSHRMFVLFGLVELTGIIIFMVSSSYARKEKVSGWLVPERGMIQIFAPQQSLVSDLRVENGARVKKCRVLLVLSTELQSAALGATQEEVIRGLKKRRKSLDAEREHTDELHLKDMDALRARLAAVQLDLSLRLEEIVLQEERLALAVQNVERIEPLMNTGTVTEMRINEVIQTRFDHQSRLQTMKREKASAQRELVDLRAEIDAKPVRHQILISQFDRNIAILEQEIAQAEARRKVVVLAPQSGTVTSLQAELGGRFDPRVPLMNIIPEGSQLQAELFIPSRARGFIQEGQEVRVRYQAFPYQKFGHYEGRVAEIALSSISQAELARELPGLTALQAAGEAIYLVKVNLPKQSVTVYGDFIPLHAGMKLETHIQIEDRKLFEWFLDPIKTITG